MEPAYRPKSTVKITSAAFLERGCKTLHAAGSLGTAPLRQICKSYSSYTAQQKRGIDATRQHTCSQPFFLLCALSECLISSSHEEKSAPSYDKHGYFGLLRELPVEVEVPNYFHPPDPTKERCWDAIAINKDLGCLDSKKKTKRNGTNEHSH